MVHSCYSGGPTAFTEAHVEEIVAEKVEAEH